MAKIYGRRRVARYRCACEMINLLGRISIRSYIYCGFELNDNFFMDQQKLISNQIKIANDICSSTNELLPLLKENPMLDESLHSTITEIFRFMHNLLKSFPDILLSKHNIDPDKAEVLMSLDKVIGAWSEYLMSPNSFFGAWERFNESWKKFSKSVERLSGSDDSIYLSMN